MSYKPGTLGARCRVALLACQQDVSFVLTDLLNAPPPLFQGGFRRPLCPRPETTGKQVAKMNYKPGTLEARCRVAVHLNFAVRKRREYPKRTSGPTVLLTAGRVPVIFVTKKNSHLWLLLQAVFGVSQKKFGIIL